MQIYIRRNRDVQGPFDFEAIQQGLDTGKIFPTDSARFEGAVEWMLVSQLPGMRIESPPVPPPIPPVVPSPKAPAPSQAINAADFQPVRVGFVTVLLTFIAVFVCTALIFGAVLSLGGSTAFSVVYPSFCLAVIGWVFFDAMALKTGRGQVAGIMNMPPWAWALSFFLFLFIAFPLYLAARPAIVRVNEQYPDNLPVATKNSGSSAVLIAGLGCLFLLFFALIAIAVLTVIGKQLSETNPELRSTATQVL